MIQQTSFEQVLGALLEDGHEVTLTKHNGTIGMKLNSEGVAISGVTLEQIGQLAIEAAVSGWFKRIDGADQVCQNKWHGSGSWSKVAVCPDCLERWQGTRLKGLRECDGCGDEVPLEEIKKIYRGKNSGSSSCQECYLDMEDK